MIAQQIAAVIRLELGKTFLRRRSLWIYLLALAPVLLVGGHALISLKRGRWSCSIGHDSTVFAAIFQIWFLRLALFFGCAGIFANLFRGEVLERSLHYYLLAPIRRDVLALGKYLSGLITAASVFGGSAAACFVLMFVHFGAEGRAFLLGGPGFGQLLAYLAVTVLACLGYGAVFLVMGLYSRNPMLPAAAVLIWENLNVFLPPLLKKFSIIFYLVNLCPVSVPNAARGINLLGVSAVPVPAYIAVPGMLAVTVLVLGIAARRVRSMDISYAAD